MYNLRTRTVIDCYIQQNLKEIIAQENTFILINQLNLNLFFIYTYITDGYLVI